MNEQQITEILAKPYAQQLLNGTDPARLAYEGPRRRPAGRVALTIDTNAFPPKVLLIRGTVELETVAGVPEGYLAGADAGP